MNNEKITRREALKCMGTTLAGLALSASGLSSITSCTEKKKRRLVFYFTGTGNCLYVARKFAENPLSIPQIIRQDKLEFEADEIGIVYPIYGHLAPQIVQEFIRKARLKAPYLFSILTYGNRKCSATELWNNLATENGTRFDYITTLKMVDNFLPSFDMNEQVKIDKQEDKQIAEIMQDIQARKHWIQPVSKEERQQHAEFMQRAGHTLSPSAEKLLVIKENCIGCGICVKVCPRRNYTLTGEGVQCKGACEYCLSCVQNCPQKAITLRAGEKNPDARYRHPDISLNDIIRANRQ